MPVKIDQLFAAENFSDPCKLEWVKQEANYLLKAMEADPNFQLAERFGRTVSPAELEHFFRHRERSEKVCQIMQYLLLFLEHIPASGEIRREPVNPAEQFHEFIRYESDLLLAEDVRDAVFHETNHKNPVPGGNAWDFQEKIVVIHRKVRNMLAKVESNVASSISIQCRALEQLCLFWFDLRRHDLRRTRRSDIFMYLLAQLVRHRCWQVEGSRFS
ncbi:MAG: hypothetical protein JXO51_07525 [Candidatus Aminicenantes bacterium]|nr:hypothetical protein [Candidatus Aminicenantes bacterium]